jgi:hypothetical protein
LIKKKSEFAVDGVFYIGLVLALGYFLLIFVFPSIMRGIKRVKWLISMSYVGGMFALGYLLLITLPTYQIIVYNILCAATDEYYSEMTCSGSRYAARVVPSIILLGMVIILSWLMAGMLKTSIPFENLYMNGPSRPVFIDYVAWPLITTVLHISGIPSFRIVNIFLIAFFGLYSVGLDLWEIGTYDESMQKFYFRVKVVFAWLYLTPALFYVQDDLLDIRK